MEGKISFGKVLGVGSFYSHFLLKKRSNGLFILYFKKELLANRITTDLFAILIGILISSSPSLFKEPPQKAQGLSSVMCLLRTHVLSMSESFTIQKKIALEGISTG